MADNPMSLDMEDQLGSLTKDPKIKESFWKETQELVTKMQAVAKSGRLSDALEELLVFEKKTRLAADGQSTSHLVCTIVTLCRDLGDWGKVREYVTILAKKRGQLKRAIIEMVVMCMKWIDELTSKEDKLSLITTLSSVTEGKIFVEVERARVIRTLSHMKEEEGNIEEAAQLLQEVQVETFGAMDKIEKAEYILDQMRVVLKREDYVRCQIMSRKINTKVIEDDDFQDIKIQYYRFLIQYFLHEQQILDVCKSFFSIFHTKKVQEDEKLWKEVLEAYALYLLLAPFGNESSDLLNKLKTIEVKKLQSLPVIKRVVEDFLKVELMPWPVPYEAELKKSAVFSDSPHSGGAARWEMFHRRVVQHNIKIISYYYSRIEMKQLSNLIGLSVDDTEAEVCELVTNKFLCARIDRPVGRVIFGETKRPEDLLNAWSSDVSGVLNLVEETCHLIYKERMVHAARAKIPSK